MRVAISAVVIRAGSILLVKKVKKVESWILPGGKPEVGESDKDCLNREVREELPGFRLSNVRHFRNIEGVTPNTGDVIRCRVYFADGEGDITPAAEISGAEWVVNPDSKNLSDLTKNIVVALREGGHL